MYPFEGARAVLFDLDGTLVETHIDFSLMRRETAALIQSFGVPVESVEGLDILTSVEAARLVLTRTGDSAAADRLRRLAFERLQEIEVTHCANPVEIAGARELLARLKANGVAVGVVTRNCRAVSEPLLHNAGLTYDVLLTRDDVPRTKPDPSHLHAVLHAFEVNPSEDPTVMVGDHWMDVRAGREAGMRTVGILLGRARDFYATALPDLLVERLADLLAYVDVEACAAHAPIAAPAG